MGERQPVLLRCAATAGLRAADIARDFALLDDDERHAAQRLRVAADRRDFVAAHALLRRTLSAEAPAVSPEAWRFDRGFFDKPVVRPDQEGHPALRFSLSHGRGLVACAVARRGELGLDVERRSGFDVTQVAEHVCSADERAQLSGLAPSDREARFLAFWTLKEAYGKARGLGLGLDLAAASFDLRHAGAIHLRPARDAAPGWHFALFHPDTDSRLALAIEGRQDIAPPIDAVLIDHDGSTVALAPLRRGTGEPG